VVFFFPPPPPSKSIPLLRAGSTGIGLRTPFPGSEPGRFCPFYFSFLGSLPVCSSDGYLYLYFWSLPPLYSFPSPWITYTPFPASSTFFRLLTPWFGFPLRSHPVDFPHWRRFVWERFYSIVTSVPLLRLVSAVLGGKPPTVVLGLISPTRTSLLPDSFSFQSFQTACFSFCRLLCPLKRRQF